MCYFGSDAGTSLRPVVTTLWSQAKARPQHYLIGYTSQVIAYQH